MADESKKKMKGKRRKAKGENAIKKPTAFILYPFTLFTIY